MKCLTFVSRDKVYFRKSKTNFTHCEVKYFLYILKDVGTKRDIVGELASAFQADNRVKFGLYHSLFEWYHPLYLQVRYLA